MSPPAARPAQVGDAWIDEPQWTCSVCGEVHPWDHEGMFCGQCMAMACCVRCERKFTGQCHDGADDPDFDDGTRQCWSCGATVVLHPDQRREPALVECGACEDERWRAIEEDEAG